MAVIALAVVLYFTGKLEQVIKVLGVDADSVQ